MKRRKTPGGKGRSVMRGTVVDGKGDLSSTWGDDAKERCYLHSEKGSVGPCKDCLSPF